MRRCNHCSYRCTFNRPGDVEIQHLEAGVGDMVGHRLAHIAEADETNYFLGHACILIKRNDGPSIIRYIIDGYGDM